MRWYIELMLRSGIEIMGVMCEVWTQKSRVTVLFRYNCSNTRANLSDTLFGQKFMSWVLFFLNHNCKTNFIYFIQIPFYVTGLILLLNFYFPIISCHLFEMIMRRTKKNTYTVLGALKKIKKGQNRCTTKKCLFLAKKGILSFLHS